MKSNHLWLAMAAAVLLLGAVCEKAHAGAIMRVYYDGIPGSSVADLKEASIFPDWWTFYEVLTDALEGVENSGDNYGSWIRGYLEAPQTGAYVFWIASDDDSELWLSTDHSEGNLVKIAENVGAVGNRAYDVKPMQRSAEIVLERGKKYYLEVFHKEATGAAHISVGWQLPDGTLQRPVPGDHLMPYPMDETWEPRPTAPLILDHFLFYPVPALMDVSVEEGQTAVFRVTVEATQPATFQWLRDGVEIEGEILSVLRLESVSSSDDGASFTVRVSNALGTAASEPVVLSVQPDFDPPTVIGAATRGNPNGVDVRFSEPVDEQTAADPANYQVAPGVSVTGATLIDSQTVRLTTSTIAEGSVYTLTVNNVKDRAAAGNVIASNSQFTFLQVQGVITEKTYLDMPGPLLSDLTGNPKFPDNPDTVQYPAQLETIPLRRDNYGVQFQGYVIPPVSGEYVFYVSSRNQSVLYLSSDENPANMTAIAEESVFSTPRDWETVRPDGANVSAPQMLEAGKKYYLEGRMKAAARPGLDFVDHFAVTWQMPGEFPPVNGGPPIPGDYLSALATLGPVTVASQPAGGGFTELDRVELQVEADGTPPYEFQWFRNGEPVPGAVESRYVIASVPLSDHQASFTVEVKNPFSSATSSAAVLMVSPKTTPPELAEVSALNIPTSVAVRFSEPVEEGSAETVANYSIEPGVTISAAELQPDSRTLVLTTSELSEGIVYTLRVNNVTDRAATPNVIAPNSERTFVFVGTDRVTRGLQILYTFQAGSGTTVRDVSGIGSPLDLNIAEPDKVAWLPGGGIEILSETRILSQGPATKFNVAAMESNELSVEVWVKPASTAQQGPARIVAVSQGPGTGDRNVSLNTGQFGQPPEQAARWTARGSTGSGMPDWFSTPVGTVTTGLHHVVFTHDANTGEARIYVDGVESASIQITGNFSDWQVQRDVALGNEAGLLGSGRFWLGEIYLVALYSRALDASEVTRNFGAGAGTRMPEGFPHIELTSPAPGAVFTAPASITLSADASDPDGTVTQVEFFQDNTLIGIATGSPFTFNWTGVGAGVYTLTARATDNDGNTATSAPVEITVRPAIAGSYDQVVLDDNPVAYWRFEETSGDLASDETGTHHALLFDQPGLNVPGRVGSAIHMMRFNGFGSYAEAPDHPDLSMPGSISIEFWLNILEGWSEGFEAIIGKGDDTFQIRREGATSSLRFDVRGGTGGNVTLISSTTIPADQWVHVVAVYDAEAGQMRFYFDGQQDPNVAARSGTVEVNSFGLQLGNNFTGAVYRRFFDGLLDEVALYDYALSAERILTHYFAADEDGAPAPSLTARIEDGQLVLSWPLAIEGFTLRATGSLSAPIVWMDAGAVISQEGGEWIARVPITGGTRFFRLEQ